MADPQYLSRGLSVCGKESRRGLKGNKTDLEEDDQPGGDSEDPRPAGRNFAETRAVL
jgi:hypothetical protein